MKGQMLSLCPSWHLCPHRLVGWEISLPQSCVVWPPALLKCPLSCFWCWIQALSVSHLDRSQRMALDLDETCFFVGAVCGWMPFTLPCSVSKAVCTFPSLFLMKPACFTWSRFFNCLNLSWLIVTEGLFRRVVGALAEGQLWGTALNFSYCSRSNHPCTTLADSNTWGQEQLATRQAEGCLLPSSPQCLAVASWACSDTLQAFAFSSWACPKTLCALNFGPCLQCRENRCRGFSRTCEDLLWRGWSASFSSENLQVPCVGWEYFFFMCVLHLAHIKIAMLAMPFGFKHGKELCPTACALCFKNSRGGSWSSTIQVCLCTLWLKTTASCPTQVSELCTRCFCIMASTVILVLLKFVQ